MTSAMTSARLDGASENPIRIWSKAGGRWTDHLVGYGLDLFHRRHLRTPTFRELREGVGDLPSLDTIWRMYGSTSAMYDQHGYKARGRGAQPGRSRNHERTPRDIAGRFTSDRTAEAPPGGFWTEMRIEAGLRRYYDRHHRLPTQREHKHGIDGLPSLCTARRLYGTTTAMYEYYGYSPRRPGGQRPEIRATG
jgi:hypothetical protein